MIRILTDSAADILPGEAARLGVEVVPLNVTLETGETLRDGVDLSCGEFYHRLEHCTKLPTTSQPSPEAFLAHFEDAKQMGDQTVAVLLSGALSGTLQSARVAAQTCEYEDIWLVDSESATMGERLLVELAVRLRAEGCTAEQIAARLEREKHRVRMMAVVNDLKYLHKGGRLPAAAAIAGSVMGIKPVVSLVDGRVSLAGKARGMPGAYVALFKLMEKQGGVDPEEGCILGFTAHPRGAEPIRQYLTGNLRISDCETVHIGTVIGTHAGPGAAGIAFFAKDFDEESEK